VLAGGAVAHLVISATTRVVGTNDSSDYVRSPTTPELRIDLTSPGPPRGWARTPAAMIDLLGNGLRPGFVVQTVYAVLPDDRSRVVVQGVAAAVGWIVLALTLASIVRRPWAKLLVVTGVVLGSLAPWVTIFHVSIAEEPLMLAASLVFVAAALALAWPGVRLCGTTARSRTVFAVLAGSFVLTSFSRPQAAALLGPLALVAIALFAFHEGVGRRDARLRGCLVAAAIIVVTTAASGLMLQNNFPRWQEQQAVQRFAVRMEDPEYVALARRVGMPRCAQLDRAIVGVRQGKYVDLVAPVVDAGLACPALARWFAAGGLSPVDIVRHEPALFVREYRDALSLLRTPGTLPPALIPFPKVPSPVPKLETVLWAAGGRAPWLGLLIALAAVAIGVVRRGLRGFAPEIVFLAATAIVGACYYAIVWSVAGMEEWRHALPLQFVANIVVWAVVLRAVSTADTPERAR
jgi:hypothetical protein